MQATIHCWQYWQWLAISSIEFCRGDQLISSGKFYAWKCKPLFINCCMGALQQCQSKQGCLVWLHVHARKVSLAKANLPSVMGLLKLYAFAVCWAVLPRGLSHKFLPSCKDSVWSTGTLCRSKDMMPCAPDLTVVWFAVCAGDVWDPQPPPGTTPGEPCPIMAWHPTTQAPLLDAQVYVATRVTLFSFK